MFRVLLNRRSAFNSARGSSILLTFLGQCLDLARKLARILREYSHPFGNRHKVHVEQAALGENSDPFVAHDRESPDAEYETGLLLEVLDQYPGHAAP